MARILFADPSGAGTLYALAAVAADAGHEVWFVDPHGDQGPAPHPTLRRGRLLLHDDEPAGIAHLRPSTRAVRTGQAVVRLLAELRRRFVPDLVVGIAGQGATLFVREVAPQTRILVATGQLHVTPARVGLPVPAGVGHDDGRVTLRERTANSTALMEIAHADWSLCATPFERDHYPWPLRARMTILHAGVDLDYWHPRPIGWPGSLDADDPDGRIRGLSLDDAGAIITASCPSPSPGDGLPLLLESALGALKLRPADRVVLLIEGDHAWPSAEGLAQQVDPARFHVIAHPSADEARRALWASQLHLAVSWCSGLWEMPIRALATATPLVGVGPAVGRTVSDSVSGFLPPPVPAQVASFVARLAAGEVATARAVGAGGRALAVERFDRAAALHRSLDVIGWVIAGNAPPVRSSSDPEAAAVS